MYIGGVPHNASRPDLTAGVINDRDEITKYPRLLLVIDFHGGKYAERPSERYEVFTPPEI